MKFISSVFLAAAVLMPSAAHAQSPAPTFTPETVYQFPMTQSWPSELVAGTDGRLYGMGNGSSPSLWSVGRDPANPAFRINSNSLFNPDGSSILVRDRSGVFYKSSNAVGKGGIYGGCPYSYTDDSGVTKIQVETFASIAKFGAGLAMAKLPVSESKPICVTLGNLTIDDSDNLYFISRIESVALPENQSAVGTRLYKLAADGSSMTLLHTFTFAEGEDINPLRLVVSHDGQWLYGLSGQRIPAAIDRGYLYRIKIDGTGYEKIYTFERPTGNPTSFNSAFVEVGGYLYVALNAGGPSLTQGALLRIKPDGTDPVYLHGFVSGDVVYGAQPIGSLAVINGAIYGVTQSGGANGSGVLYRINPAAVTGPDTGMEVLHHFASGWSGYAGLTAGIDGKLYGSATIGTDLTSIYVVDVGYVPPGPIVTLSADPPEVTWDDGQTQPVSLTWTAQNAAACVLEGPGLASSTVASSGSQQVAPIQEGDNVYTLTCDSGSGLPDGTAVQRITVKAIAPAAPPTLVFTGPGSATMGGSATLSWQATDALSCTASGAWSGNKPLDADGKGSQDVPIAQTQAASTLTYTLTCNGAGGSVTRSVDVMSVIPLGIPTSMSVRGGGGALPYWLLLALLPLWPVSALARRRRITHT